MMLVMVTVMLYMEGILAQPKAPQGRINKVQDLFH